VMFTTPGPCWRQPRVLALLVFTTHVRVMFTTSLESNRHFEVSVVGGFDFS
jgi:hypothetical protein